MLLEERQELQGEDYTSLGGYRNVKPASLVPDLSVEELDALFARLPLQAVLSNMERVVMSVPGGMTAERLFRLKQLVAKRVRCFSEDNDKPRPVKFFKYKIDIEGNPVSGTLRPYSIEQIK